MTKQDWAPQKEKRERERDSEREEHVGKTEDMLEAWLDPLEGQCESGGDEAIRRKLS